MRLTLAAALLLGGTAAASVAIAQTAPAPAPAKGTSPAEKAEQTRTTGEAAAGPVKPATANGPQLGTYGFDTAGMDKAASTGDNFYEYANGTWQKTTQIPADRSVYGMFHVLRDLSQERTRAILEDERAKAGSKPGMFYASFMDEAAVEAKGVAPIQPWLAEIAALKDRSAAAKWMGTMARQGVPGLFGMYVSPDDKQPDTYIAQFSQGGIALPDRDYYLKDDPKLADTRTKYQAYLAQMLTMLGEKDTETRAAAVFQFEKGLATAHWTRIESRDADKTYNKWAAADFPAKAPGFDWAAFLGAEGLGQQPAMLVAQPSAFAGEAKLFGATPLPVIQDYLRLRLASAYAPYLSKQFSDARFAFFGTVLSGTPEQQVRWKRGADLVTGQMGEAVAPVYVQRYFPPEAKAAADELVKNLIAAMGERLDKLEWMAPETKVKARAKLAAFTPKIGYPDTWRDYSGLEVQGGDLVGNVARGNAFEFAFQLGKLGKPIDRGEWFMTPMTVNAYANPVMNEVVFPAAILQPPFFDPKADPAVNYGGIGAVIGHEISHHFDDQGRKYDPTGKLADWWTPQDVERFKVFTDRLVAQYDAYQPIKAENGAGAQNIQGGLTLGENIADLAGITVAYDAYHRSLKGKKAPVIDGTTGDQRFYLGWAQVWRTKWREPALRSALLSDPHSPGEFRADTVRNVDPWYQAFKPKAGTMLYLTPEQRVRIW